ncbi:MAG: hypothetical protein EPO26_00785 [Chloroflexota bacterium]|nr:MAG: hypothetical protein EPO26_00785 [Chloroflexota bacterium]
MIRALRPTDIAAVLAFSRQRDSVDVLADDDLPRIGFSIRETIERSLALRPGRETWIAIESGRVDGIVSAQARFGADMWDIDALRIAASVDADRVCLSLLDHLMHAAHEEGILKVFLRLPAEANWSVVARQAGFARYARESTYVSSLPPNAEPVDIDTMRPRRPADHLALFHLYSSLVPLGVREVEAMTLQEWRWLDNWGVVAPVRPRLPGNRRDFIVAHDGEIDVWLQIRQRQRRVQMLLDPTRSDVAEGLVHFAIAHIRGIDAIRFVARDYQESLRRVLSDSGFVETESEDLFARILTVRVPDMRLIPARAL